MTKPEIIGPCSIYLGDSLDILWGMDSDSVDLILTSPPYEAARSYGIDFNLRGQDWVDWCVPRFLECLRVSRGLVAWVIEGQTRDFRWSAAPMLLAADLHRAGVYLRKPPVFHRSGIPGSGGPDWWRNDYEFILCASTGRLPWSDNTATGHPCKYRPGGKMSYRVKNGNRHCSEDHSGPYVPPTKANPGNVIHCIVGGGHMGSDLAHDGEAAFPEDLVLPFILSFCPPGGIVLDPFSGSGTTAAVAVKTGRKSISIDCRESQCELTRRRIVEAMGQCQADTPDMPLLAKEKPCIK